MTILDTRQRGQHTGGARGPVRRRPAGATAPRPVAGRATGYRRDTALPTAPRREPQLIGPVRVGPRRPVRMVVGSPRPGRSPRDPRTGGGAPVRFRGPGLLMTRASRRRPITPVTTVLLALVAAAITLWLGLVAQIGGVVGESAPAPGRLAVVQVHAGETLYQVARRVAPDAPVGQVVEQIRELNQLESPTVNPGQTLIAPVG